MTAPAIIEDDPLEQLLKLKKSPASEVDPLEALMATKTPTGHNGVPFVDAPEIANAKSAARGHGGKPFVDAADDDALDWRDKVLGTVAATGRDIPGVEAAQAGVRALIRRQPYRQAREDIRSAEDAAPGLARNAARIGGGAVAAMAIPGGPALQGARYGVAAGLGDSDPDAAVKDRLNPYTLAGRALLGGAAGGVLGGLGKVASTVKNAPPGGLKKIAEAALPDMVRRPLRIARAYQNATKPAAPAPAVAPKAEGLQSAIETAGERQGPTGVIDAIKRQGSPPSTAVVDAVKQAPRKQAGRTQAQLDNFAGRQGKPPNQPAHRTAPPTLAEPPQGLPPEQARQLEDLLTKARRQAPMSGNTVGDAEIAQGLDAPPLDLEELLRQSITAFGGKPIPRAGVP